MVADADMFCSRYAHLFVSQMSAVEEKRGGRPARRHASTVPHYVIYIRVYVSVAKRALNDVLSAVITTPPAESVGASRGFAEPLDVLITHSLNYTAKFKSGPNSTPMTHNCETRRRRPGGSTEGAKGKDHRTQRMLAITQGSISHRLLCKLINSLRHEAI